ncbi:GNAT family N-acetyltransferase [Brevundimonas phoenicis]
MSGQDFNIRKFVASDAPDLARLYFNSARTLGARRYSADQVAAWAPAPVAAEVVEKRALDGRLTLVATDLDGKVIAYGDLEQDGHIDHLYANPVAAGRGIAGALLNALIAAAETSGVQELRVEASELAKGLFERAGFCTIARRDFEVNGVPIHNFAMTRRSAS